MRLLLAKNDDKMKIFAKYPSTIDGENIEVYYDELFHSQQSSNPDVTANYGDNYLDSATNTHYTIIGPKPTEIAIARVCKIRIEITLGVMSVDDMKSKLIFYFEATFKISRNKIKVVAFSAGVQLSGRRRLLSSDNVEYTVVIGDQACDNSTGNCTTSSTSPSTSNSTDTVSYSTLQEVASEVVNQYQVSQHGHKICKVKQIH